MALLGQFRLCLGGQPVDLPSRPFQKFPSCPEYRACQSVLRVKLGGIMWPHSAEDAGRKKLRHYIWGLVRIGPGSSRVSG